MENVYGADGKCKKIGTLFRKNMDFCSNVLNLICYANLLSHFSHTQKTYLTEIYQLCNQKNNVITNFTV